jgi:VIT1/CCC1 family predicted Fe2+/Mn2+ transporter
LTQVSAGGADRRSIGRGGRTMDSYLHRETHFQASDTVRDVVIGMADGLTVPFALAAGISGAAAGVDLVVTAGVAEVAAGSIAMGLGGYLAARSEQEHYVSERAREEREIVEKPEAESREIAEIFERYGLGAAHYAPLVEGLKANPVAWRDFMMRFELGLEEPQPQRAKWSALTIAGAYVVGGFIPLAPYLVHDTVARALPWSIAITLAALAIFGYIKGHFTGAPKWASALQTLAIGGVAAGVAFALARLIG